MATDPEDAATKLLNFYNLVVAAGKTARLLNAIDDGEKLTLLTEEPARDLARVLHALLPTGKRIFLDYAVGTPAMPRLLATADEAKLENDLRAAQAFDLSLRDITVGALQMVYWYLKSADPSQAETPLCAEARALLESLGAPLPVKAPDYRPRDAAPRGPLQ